MLNPKKPEGSHHKNVPLLHCSKCTQQIRKILQIQKHIEGKKFSAQQVFILLEIIDKIKLNKGITDKERTPEHTVVVLGHKDGTKTTIEDGKNRNDRKKWSLLLCSGLSQMRSGFNADISAEQIQRSTDP